MDKRVAQVTALHQIILGDKPPNNKLGQSWIKLFFYKFNITSVSINLKEQLFNNNYYKVTTNRKVYKYDLIVFSIAE